MKNNLLTLISLFVFLSIILFGAVITLGQIQHANLGDCATNSTGGLENCSLSTAQYNQQTASASTSSYMFNTLQLILLLLVVAIFVSAGYLLIRAGK